MMKQGEKAPEFTLPDSTGEEISLKDYRGQWVVLYFYPKDNTPGCTVEAKDFTRLKGAFEKLNSVILGVSPDSEKSHCNFTEKQDLSIILLSDKNRSLLEAYGAWQLKKNYGREYMGVVRSTVLIDPDGKVADYWTKVRAKEHAEKVLERLGELTRTSHPDI